MKLDGKILVTGGTGFLGLRMIYELLKRNYDVRTTIRSDSGRERILSVLKKNGIKNADKLSFAIADLADDQGWDEAMKDIKYVFSVAAPVFFEIPKDEQLVINPVVEGTLRILKAAQNAGVKRVVMTSNFGAVGFSKKKGDPITTEKDWSNPNEPGISAYEKSKLIAETKAWEYIQNEGRGLEFVTVNPVAILGPSLDEHFSGSFGLLTGILNGNLKIIPNIPLNVVDVRDVAEVEILAMETPEAAGQRFLVSADGQISYPEVSKLLKEKRPKQAASAPTRTLPDFIVDLAAVFSKQGKEAKLLLHMNRNVSNQKAKDMLGWKPISDNEQAILSAADSIVKYGSHK